MHILVLQISILGICVRLRMHLINSYRRFKALNVLTPPPPKSCIYDRAYCCRSTSHGYIMRTQLCSYNPGPSIKCLRSYLRVLLFYRAKATRRGTVRLSWLLHQQLARWLLISRVATEKRGGLLEVVPQTQTSNTLVAGALENVGPFVW